MPVEAEVVTETETSAKTGVEAGAKTLPQPAEESITTLSAHKATLRDEIMAVEREREEVREQLRSRRASLTRQLKELLRQQEEVVRQQEELDREEAALEEDFKRKLKDLGV